MSEIGTAPLPWGTADYDPSDVIDAEGAPIASAFDRVGAALIVRAVNAHAELVAALSEIVTRCGNGEPYCTVLDEIARAALAKAKGERP